MRVKMMIATTQQSYYMVFGLRVVSEIPMPELLRASTAGDEADIEICRGDLREEWETLGYTDDQFAFSSNGVLFHIPGTAIFRVREGKQIMISPSAEAEEKTIRLYLLGSCMGILLLQRGILPLHGSAVVIDGKAYAIVGDSGAGKSTLAAAFLEYGYQLLTDDVIAVSIDNNENCPIVYPAYPQQKLWQESLEQLGMETDRYHTIYSSKYAVPVRSRFCLDPIKLAGIFELMKTEEQEVEIEQVEGIGRLPILQMHTFRDFLVPQLAGEQWHFSKVAALASKVNVYQLRRPVTRFSTNELVSKVMQTVNDAVLR